VPHRAGLAHLYRWATSQPSSVAIASTSGTSLSYAELVTTMDAVGAGLRASGISRHDVVGIVVENGPLAATSFLAVANAAAAAPLNPAYRRAEFEYYMGDLGMKAVIVQEGVSDPAESVAADLGVAVIRPEEFIMSPEEDALAASPGMFDDPTFSDDVALILHTSGTTSRPKMVPLRHRNLSASAESIARTLELTSADRCLNVMPLFHIHGLVAAVLASLHAGGSVVCAPGFVAPEFFGWLQEEQPTWFTAVPTIHQSIVERAAHEAFPGTSSLRFARSSSSSLAPQLKESFEDAFGVPMIEAYGMTEAAHQMASNPLPPGIRKAGSVGLAAGPRIAIMDAAGRLVATGIEGEIVISGASVIDGYLGNDDANVEAYEAGWFRTGDLGRLDGDGYLFISGRKKEVINRGGETISPREIDEVLLDHPDVVQALTFAVPDSRLGEQIGAAVVLRQGAAATTEDDIRRFAQERLSDAKVPRRVVFLDEIPKGPTGKLQRIGMAERLGLDDLDGRGDERPYVAPSSTIEVILAELWQQVLGVESPSVEDRFLDVGGDSLLAVRLLAAIRSEMGVELSMVDLSDKATIVEQAELVEASLLDGGDHGA
jgi:oxalate---CoA ligase